MPVRTKGDGFCLRYYERVEKKFDEVYCRPNLAALARLVAALRARWANRAGESTPAHENACPRGFFFSKNCVMLQMRVTRATWDVGDSFMGSIGVMFMEDRQNRAGESTSARENACPRGVFFFKKLRH